MGRQVYSKDGRLFYVYGPSPVPLEARVRERFNPLVQDSSPLVLRRITAVGAEGALGVDAAHYVVAMRAFAHLGIPLASDLQITSMDLMRNGRDFLRDPPASDLVITCFINNPPEENHSSENSSLHHIPGIWAKTAAQAGAKVIVTSGASPHEIGEADFESPQYVFLGFNVGLEPGSYFGKAGSVLVHRDYLPVLQRHGRSENVRSLLRRYHTAEV